MISRYSSVFSGTQIDEAIAGMQGAVTGDIIVNDFSGGTTKVASAQLAVILNNSIIAATTSSNLVSVLTAGGYPPITTAQYNKLNQISPAFVGSFANPTTRTAGTNTIPYVGTEISVLVDDATGRSMSQISRWDIPTSAWKLLRIYNVDEYPPVPVVTASTVPIYSFSMTQFSFIKLLVCCADSAGVNRQVQECLVTFVGTTPYVSVYGQVGSSSTLFTLSASITGTTLTVSATTSIANTVLSYKMTDMM